MRKDVVLITAATSPSRADRRRLRRCLQLWLMRVVNIPMRVVPALPFATTLRYGYRSVRWQFDPPTP